MLVVYPLLKTFVNCGTSIMSDVREENEEKWREATNKVIVENLLEKIEELLDAKVRHLYCCDKKTQYEKIVIEYNHRSK